MPRLFIRVNSINNGLVDIMMPRLHFIPFDPHLRILLLPQPYGLVDSQLIFSLWRLAGSELGPESPLLMRCLAQVFSADLKDLGCELWFVYYFWAFH